MKISRKADYALRAVVFLSRQPEDKRSSINEIAESEEIPRDFLAKILKDLTRAQILRSYQGVRGGYRLAKEPSKINMLEVIEAMDGPIGVSQAMRDKTDYAGMYPFWNQLQNDVMKSLANKSIDSFIAARKRTRGKSRAKARK